MKKEVLLNFDKGVEKCNLIKVNQDTNSTLVGSWYKIKLVLSKTHISTSDMQYSAFQISSPPFIQCCQALSLSLSLLSFSFFISKRERELTL